MSTDNITETQTPVPVWEDFNMTPWEYSKAEGISISNLRKVTGAKHCIYEALDF